MPVLAPPVDPVDPGLQFGSCVVPEFTLQSTVPLWLDPELVPVRLRVWDDVDPESARRVPVVPVSVDDVVPVEPLLPLPLPPPIDEHPPSIATAAAAAITIPNCFFMTAPLRVWSPPPAATPM